MLILNHYNGVLKTEIFSYFEKDYCCDQMDKMCRFVLRDVQLKVGWLNEGFILAKKHNIRGSNIDLILGMRVLWSD